MNRILMGLGVSAALLPLTFAPAAQAALDPPLPTPATVLFHTPIAGSQNTALGGSLCRASYTCVSVPYVPFIRIPFFPSFTGADVAVIEKAVNATPGQKILFGYSGAAETVSDWLREHANDTDAPPVEDLTVFLLGNPSRKYGGINAPGSVTPDTQYQIVDVTRQYDYNSDYPTDRFNLLASANAAAGFFFIHLDYSAVDINDPNNIVWTENNTTYVFVPTQNIPLLEPLRRIGLTQLADQWNDVLKARIEQAYDRSYLPTATPQPVVDTAPSPSTPAPAPAPAPASSLIASSSRRAPAPAPVSPPPITGATNAVPLDSELDSQGPTIETSTRKVATDDGDQPTVRTVAGEHASTPTGNDAGPVTTANPAKDEGGDDGDGPVGATNDTPSNDDT